jgi:dipeptidyl aminopeptidase/acylaminoacyl peptidase
VKNIQLNDLYNFNFLSNLNISKDGENLVYIKHTADADKNAYNSDIQIHLNKQCKRLTSSHNINDYIFVDNETLLFSSVRTDKEKARLEKGEEFTAFYTLSLTGGEAQKAFEIPYPVEKITKVSDDDYIVLISYDLRYSKFIDDNKLDTMLETKKELASHEIFTAIPFVANGVGYTNKKVSRLYRFKVSTQQLTPLTNTDYTISHYDVDLKRQKVLFLATQTIARPTLKDGLFEIDLSTNKTQTCIPEKDYDISNAYYLDKNIIFFANKDTVHGSNENQKLFLWDANKQAVTLIANPDLGIGNGVGSDCRFGKTTMFKVVDNTFYFLATKNSNCSLFCLNKDSTIQEMVKINGSVDDFSIYNNIVYFIGLESSNLQEIYTFNMDSKQLNKISAINTALENKYVATPQPVHFKNDNIDFTGWVLLPYDYQENKQYPAILDIHGGPKTVYGTVYYHEMQVWANKGYFVFFTNPRGSDGRGNDFMDIFGQYGDIDYNDLMKFTDTVCETYPAIDKTRIGVTGGSYGGFMTNWIITHTDRFACAATQRCISNWVSFYGTSDIGFHFAEDQIRGNIWDSPEKLWKHSPLKYIKNAKTPTLIIHSDEDYRCPEEQAMQLYTALVDLKVETRMVLFHGENHELSRNGKPRNRILRLEEITTWMETYLNPEK